MLEARRYYGIFIILAVTLILCLKMALSISCTNCGNYGYCAKKGVNDTCDQCKCPAGFNGNCCEIMPPPGCNANPCPPENYTCINHEAGQYRCDCEAGNTAIDPCEPDPCGVGADTCYANGTETWSCECGNDYTGNRCESIVL
uniref:EGF-like domain-containing protein n=1 Tax=Acrobeloides nanus TaxID=290746 RepID=A0A914CH30_9BILA